MKVKVLMIETLNIEDRKTPLRFPIKCTVKTENGEMQLEYVPGSRLSPKQRSEFLGLMGGRSPIYSDANFGLWEAPFLLDEIGLETQLTSIKKIKQ